jgi:hypothetical protein
VGQKAKQKNKQPTHQPHLQKCNKTIGRQYSGFGRCTCSKCWAGNHRTTTCCIKLLLKLVDGMMQSKPGVLTGTSADEMAVTGSAGSQSARNKADDEGGLARPSHCSALAALH